MKLSDAFREVLANWRDDLPTAWRTVFAGADPDFAGVDAALVHEPWEPIFPSRKGKRILGAPKDAHIFRAFDKLQPKDVRVVLVGQDPYPDIADATGRAFEQGNLTGWVQDGHRVAKSLKRVIQVAADTRVDHRRYVNGDAGWQSLLEDLSDGRVEVPEPSNFFDGWRNQGVLLLNTGLTISRFGTAGSPDAEYQFKGHLPLWKPILERAFTAIATRPTGKVVFLLWGQPAAKRFAETGVRVQAEQAGTFGTRVRVVSKAHPAAGNPGGSVPFLAGPNTLGEVNDALDQMGEEPIEW